MRESQAVLWFELILNSNVMKTNLLLATMLKTMKDPDLLAEAKRKNFDITPSTGEELVTLAKQVMAQSPEVIARVKTLMEQ